MIASAPTTALAEADWHARRRAHEQRVSAWTAPHQARAARGEKHPVEDFLFEYYRFRPAWLRRWHPGPDVVLQGESARDFLRWPEYHEVAEGVALNVAALEPRRRESVAWIANLLRLTAERPPQFACFGLHEWAMVYRQTPNEVRHNAWPLRFPPDELARIVEAQPVRCSHFDAFRFFTSPARPLNRLQPERATAPQFEQRGCLHANMDLYKWCYKLGPLVDSELLVACLELAAAARELDMRASPYDLRRFGFDPIRIEEPSGRAEYVRCQGEIAARAAPLRLALLSRCERLSAYDGASEGVLPAGKMNGLS